MKLKVIETFVDKETKKLYVRHGFFQSDNEMRIAELQENGYLENSFTAGSLTPPSSDEAGLKSLPGGYYELPNGEKVRGKAKAIEALEALNNSDGEGGDGDGSQDGDGSDGGTGESGDGQEPSPGGSE